MCNSRMLLLVYEKEKDSNKNYGSNVMGVRVELYMVPISLLGHDSGCHRIHI